MGRLSEELKDVIDVLVESEGFNINDEIYDPSSFGNARLELAAKDVVIEFARDRGQTIVNLQKRGTEETCTLETVLGLIGGPEKIGFETRQVSSILLKYLAPIRKALVEQMDE